MVKRILLVGGGTGGHTAPLVAVAEELKKIDSTVELELMGDGSLLERAGRDLGIPFVSIASAKWRRYFSVQNFLDIFKLPLGLCQSFYYVWRFMPDVIFAKGGYASILPVLAGKVFFIPVIIHESDAIPGLANKFLSIFAKKIFLGFESTQSYFKPGTTEVVGNPIRPELFQQVDQALALKTFQFTETKPTILISGGSQGARAINEMVALTLIQLTQDYHVIHQCGERNYENFNKQIENIIKEEQGKYDQQIKQNYRLYPYLNATQLSQAYAFADLVIARAGASIFEFAALGKPMVLIPLPSAASGHQMANAKEIAAYGAHIIEESNLTPHIFLNEITQVYLNRSQLAENIKRFARPDAATRIANYLLQVVL